MAARILQRLGRAASMRVAGVRRMGGHGHGASPAESPASFYSEAVREIPDEISIVKALIAAGIVFHVYNYFNSKSARATLVTRWDRAAIAREEAIERLAREEAGLPVEYGVHYVGVRQLKENHLITEEQAAALEGGAVTADVLHSEAGARAAKVASLPIPRGSTLAAVRAAEAIKAGTVSDPAYVAAYSQRLAEPAQRIQRQKELLALSAGAESVTDTAKRVFEQYEKEMKAESAPIA